MQKSFGRVSGAMAALGVGLSVAGLVAFARSSIDAIAHLDDLSEKTSLSVERLSQLQEVARIGGHSLDEVAGAASKFAKSVSAAAGGNDELIRLFKQVGISAADLKNKSFDELFVSYATAIAGAEDKTNALAVAMKLSGKSASELLPFFNDLRERGLGVARVMTEQAAAAGRFQKNLATLSTSTAAARDGIVINLLPGLVRVSEEFKKSVEQGDNLLIVLAKVAKATFFGDDRQQKEKEFIALVDKKLSREKEFQSLRQLPLLAGPLARAEVEKQREALLAAHLREDARIAQLQKELTLLDKIADKPKGRTVGAVPDAGALAAMEAARKKAEELAKFYDEVSQLGASIDVRVPFIKDREQLEKIKKTLQEGKKDWIAHADAVFSIADAENTANASGESFTETMEKLREGVREAVDPAYKLTKQFEALDTAVSTGWISEADAKFAKLDARIRSLLQPTANIFETIQKSWEKGLLSDDEMERALQAALSESGFLNKELKDTEDFAKSLGLTFSSAFEDAVIGGKKFRDVLQGIASDVAKMILRKQVTEPLANAVGKLDFGDILKRIFGSGGGHVDTIAAALPVQGPYAVGTDYVPRTGLAFVHQGEKITPAGQRDGGVNFTQNINVDSRSDQLSIRHAMAVAREESVVAMQDRQRRRRG